ncbi:hypothetical protein R1flu_009264 [Riccia fluitans]|uniref:RBR-type E3 ubiquitin transferase n=1 Tax=Riccia fluitans TaxID=41844 RepID=A0ABD1Z4L0_9MARC
MNRGGFMGGDWELAYKMQLEEAITASILDSAASELTTDPLELSVRGRRSHLYRRGQPISSSDILKPANELQFEGREFQSTSVKREQDIRDGQYAQQDAESLLLELERSEKDLEFALSLVGVSDDETECPICVEKVPEAEIFRVEGCSHHFCLNCLTQHVQVRINSRQVPVKCPQDCLNVVDIDQCRSVLSVELLEAYGKCLTEVAVPDSERVYCPFRNCSSFMARAPPNSAGTSAAAFIGPTECMECHRLFCADCLVPWHADMSCDDYQNLPPGEREAEDIKLKNFASSQKWQQCQKCRRMIELAEGCYHITCRCGHEFCYTCGAPWVNNKATCGCDLWDEAQLLRTFPRRGRIGES